MENNRDDFSSLTKTILAKRVGYLCSHCYQPTIGANELSDKSTSIGMAAHITAASPGGPRYDASLTSDERKDISNGIWLCYNCATLIDNDHLKYTVDIIYDWKIKAERNSMKRIVPKQINIVRTYNPILEADLVGGGRMRINEGYSNKNPIVEHEGRQYRDVSGEPIIHWLVTFQFKLVIYNNSNYPAINIKIESIGIEHFSKLGTLRPVNNLASLSNIELKVEYEIRVEADWKVPDAMMKLRYPEQFKAVKLKLTYLDEERNEHISFIEFTTDSVINVKE